MLRSKLVAPGWERETQCPNCPSLSRTYQVEVLRRFVRGILFLKAIYERALKSPICKMNSELNFQ